MKPCTSSLDHRWGRGSPGAVGVVGPMDRVEAMSVCHLVQLAATETDRPGCDHRVSVHSPDAFGTMAATHSPRPRTVTDEQPNNPLHGVTLERVVTELSAHYGWDGLARRININCFKHEPSVKSTLKFLRRTPWARAEVEALYVETFC